MFRLPFDKRLEDRVFGSGPAQARVIVERARAVTGSQRSGRAEQHFTFDSRKARKAPWLSLACKLPSGRFLSGQKNDRSYLMWTSDRWLVTEVRVAVSSLPLAAPWSSL